MKRNLLKSISAILVVLLIVFSVPFVSVSAETMEGTTNDGFFYKITDGEVTITAYEGEATDLAIPGTIEGYPVTVIGEDAFNCNFDIESVVIPEGVRIVDGYAFYGCDKLTDITLPKSVEQVGTYAFAETGYYDDEANWEDGLLYLEHFLINTDLYISGECTVKEGITHIGEYVFFYADVEKVNLPEGLLSIGYGAFEKCSKLVSVNLPDSLETIGPRAFWACTELVEITIPDGVTRIEKEAFWACNKLETVVFSDNLTYIGDEAFSGCDVLKKADIPSGVTYIGGSAFSHCNALEDVTIPEKIQTIGDYAFMDCTQITSAVIPEGALEVGEFAFYYCTALETFSLPSTLQSLGRAAIAFTAFSENEENWTDDNLIVGTVLVNQRKNDAEEYVVPDGITLIADAMFWNSKVKRIVVSEDVKYIGALSIYECRNLTNVVIPQNVEYISPGNFNQVPKGVTIYGYEGSRAESFAKEKGINFALYREEGYSTGDVNMDGDLNVKDATTIQKQLASLVNLSIDAQTLADYNSDGNLNVKDATAIQKSLAGLV